MELLNFREGEHSWRRCWPFEPPFRVFMKRFLHWMRRVEVNPVPRLVVRGPPPRRCSGTNPGEYRHGRNAEHVEHRREHEDDDPRQAGTVAAALFHTRS